jgi:hypothetical protein
MSNGYLCWLHDTGLQYTCYNIIINIVNHILIFQGQNKVIILLNEPTGKEDKLKITIDKNGECLEVTSVKRRNPYTLHFQMPGEYCCSC